MTVTHVETGYLETPYLESEYLSVNVLGYMGQQAQFVINDDKALGMQCQILIVDHQTSLGQQAGFGFIDALYPKGMQANFVYADALKTLGQQCLISTSADPKEIGQQAKFIIATGDEAYGMQYQQTNINHLQCQGYLEDDYLVDAYLAQHICGHMGQQAKFIILATTAIGQQAKFSIINALKALGQQAKFVINATLAIGQQAEFIHVTAIGQQVTVVLYNTTNLRMLCEFPSRGLSTATGLNAWGNTAGQGLNWKANSTAAGDFNVSNLNTDIVEQVWRSTMDTGVNLDCDTERPQGVFLDTLAILEHNFTSSATVNLIGSNDPTFGIIGVTIPLEARDDDPNIYYIAPSLPTQGWRYWRIAIDDASNPDNYLQVGTIIFGAARIFVGECFVDEVEFQLKDYTDSVQTEGFTNVNNSRAQKKILRLDFRSLSYLKSNFRLMRSMFRDERTVLKCLWIPTPDPVIQEYTARFALFSKLVQIPSERHNHKGGDADYVSFSIELDESK